jgi:hypothetical protein
VVVFPAVEPSVAQVDQSAAADLFGRLTEVAGFENEQALDIAAHVLQSTSSEVRKAVKRQRISVKQQNASRS